MTQISRVEFQTSDRDVTLFEIYLLIVTTRVGFRSHVILTLTGPRCFRVHHRHTRASLGTDLDEFAINEQTCYSAIKPREKRTFNPLFVHLSQNRTPRNRNVMFCNVLKLCYVTSKRILLQLICMWQPKHHPNTSGGVSRG